MSEEKSLADQHTKLPSNIAEMMGFIIENKNKDSREESAWSYFTGYVHAKQMKVDLADNWRMT